MIEKIILLQQLSALFQAKGFAPSIEEGSVCLGRPSKDNALMLSASCVLPNGDIPFRVRVIEHHSKKDNSVLGYNIKLNGPGETTLSRDDFNPNQGFHSHLIKNGIETKNVHVKTSGNLQEIADKIVQAIRDYK